MTLSRRDGLGRAPEPGTIGRLVILSGVMCGASPV
ncbi:hypothetical protein SAMN04489732_12937 [Amycolatopsis saalfeldensis]|uniref:Uncharacterized protein n=1 Tax=Amycolatopsis saalfeldensis TaxID=394193 RepID=A0A1H8YNI5_9PSEU|nr:hypothetical protein SAMN04489732_12937 [Amycolatopsis saalfeldensis]